MENSILISPRGARFWEAQSTPRELGNQAEDGFLLNHSEQNAPSAYSWPRNKLERAASLGSAWQGAGRRGRAAGLVSSGTVMGWMLILTLLLDRGVAAHTQAAL